MRKIIVEGTTNKIRKFLKDNEVNIKKLSDDAGIQYDLLYASVRNKHRNRTLRVDEFLSICKVLDISANDFLDKTQY